MRDPPAKFTNGRGSQHSWAAGEAGEGSRTLKASSEDSNVAGYITPAKELEGRRATPREGWRSRQDSNPQSARSKRAAFYFKLREHGSS